MSRRRRILRLLFLVAATLLVLVLAARLGLRVYATGRLERAQERFRSEAGPLQLAAYAPPAVTEREENAAAWLRAGADALILTEQESAFLVSRSRSLGEPWPRQEAKQMQDLLRRHAPARELLQRAVGLETSSFEIGYAHGPEIEIPNFIPLLTAGRLLSVEMDYRLARGDLEGARRTVQILARLVASLRRESLVITALVASAVERLWLDRVAALGTLAANTDTVRALAADLEYVEQSAVPMHRPFAADGAAAYEGLARLPPAPSALGRFLTHGWRRPLESSLLLERLVLLVEHMDRPLAEQDPEALWRESSPAWVDWLGADTLAKQLVPENLPGLQKEQAVLAGRRLARTTLEVRLRGLADGAYPERPPEPVRSPFTGEEALYERQADGSVVLALPGDAAAWERIPTPRSASGFPSPPFRWRLPPIPE